MGSAIVIEGHANGLGLLRALGSKGVDTYLVDKNKYNLGRYSRFCKGFFSIPKDDYNDHKRFVNFLEELKKKLKLDRPIIFPTHDDQVFVLSKYKKRLEKNFIVSVPDWEVTEKCYNKVLTSKIAKEIDIPIPKSFFIKDGTTLEEINKSVDYPCIIKPGIMHEFYEKSGKKAFKVHNFGEMKEKFREASSITDPENLIIQDIIPGGPENLYSYGCFFKDGYDVASLLKISRRQVPMDFGTSTYVEKAYSDEVTEMSKKLLDHIDYNGLCEVEFKKDPRDGEFRFFEINPRPWKWHSLFLANGINVPYILYKDMIGEDIERYSQDDIDDIKWIDIYTDLYISVSEILKGRMSFKEYVSSLKCKKTFAVYQKDDIMPFVMETFLLPYFYKQRT